MAKYQLIFEDNERGCVGCPYSYYEDDDEVEVNGEIVEQSTGFYCRKHGRYLGNYVNRHGLIPIPDWCQTVKKISD